MKKLLYSIIPLLTFLLSVVLVDVYAADSEEAGGMNTMGAALVGGVEVEEEEAQDEEDLSDDESNEDDEDVENAEEPQEDPDEVAKRKAREEQEAAIRARREAEERKRREEEARIAALNKEMIPLAKDLKWDAVIRLVEQGAQIDAKDEEGYTPLHYCVIDGDYTNMLLLSNAKASFKAVADNGMSILHAAVLYNHKNMVDYMLKTRAVSPLTTMTKSDPKTGATNGASPLYDAARKCDYEMVQVLLSYGADPKVANNNGLTPLHQACARGNLDMVKALLREDADINAAAADGKTPLHYACMRNKASIAAYLIQKKANVNCYDNKGFRPIHYAAETGNTALVKALVAAKALVDVQAADGTTPMLSGAKFPTLIRYFSEKGLSMNASNGDGDTVLHMAVIKGDADTIRFILFKGAMEDVKNKKGITPLMVAIENGNIAAVKALVNMEVDVTPQMLESTKVEEIKAILTEALKKKESKAKEEKKD